MTTQILRLEHITKKYKRRLALQKVSAAFPRGARIGLVGPNGAGKTTLMSIIAGLVPQFQGNLQWVEETSFRYAPQDPVFPRRINVLDMMMYYGRLEGLSGEILKQEVQRVLNAVDLWGARDLSSDTLSHGMRKRVCIAQAFLCSHPFIMLDEPTAGLDPVNADRIRNAIVAKGPNQTILVSSHNLDEIESCCDHVMILSEGQCSYFGALSDFTRNDETLEVLFATPSPTSLSGKLQNLMHVEGISYSQDGLTATLRVNSEHQTTVMSEVLKWGQENEVTIESIRKGVSLTSRFLEKTRD